MITIIIPIPVLTERHAIILRERSQVLLQGDIRDDLIGAVTYTCLVNGHELVLHCAYSMDLILPSGKDILNVLHWHTQAVMDVHHLHVVVQPQVHHHQLQSELLSLLLGSVTGSST